MTQNVTWHRGVFDSLDLTRTLPTVVRIDNKSAQSLANNPVFHQRSKHTDVKFHWLREKVADKTISLIYVASVDQRADILTKVLDGATFHRHVDRLMVIVDSM